MLIILGKREFYLNRTNVEIEQKVICCFYFILVKDGLFVLLFVRKPQKQQDEAEGRRCWVRPEKRVRSSEGAGRDSRGVP